MSKKITQREVAGLAKVSTGTVSRVINNHPLVSKKAKKKVLRAIETLNYTPNLVARSLAQGRTQNILVEFLDKNPILPSTWQYELPILQGINDFFALHDYSIQIGMHSLDSSSPEKLLKKILSNKSVDGFIILTSWDLDKMFVDALAKTNIPTVFLGNGPYNFEGTPVGTTILFDNYHIIQEAYTLLHSLGHRRIAFITGSENQLHAKLRLDAFREAARKYQEDLPEEYIYYGDYSVNSGTEGIHAFFKIPETPTAIICSNDLMAIGAMRAAKELSLNIPQDISIIGFDDIEVALYSTPPLTSVKVPTYELGTLGARKLLESIHEGIQGETHTLPSTLIVRNSVCRLNDQTDS
ncbi:MAG: LacI family DNA-binding transcriptional regulator [Sphaerochaetaceae bacterium]|jgi:LacI family transcriptional regulator